MTSNPWAEFGEEIDAPVQPSTTNSNPWAEFGEEIDAPQQSQEQPSFIQSLYKTTKEFPEQAYKTGKNIAKGALSGATLGGTEQFEGLKPEDTASANVGRFIGAVAPIGAAAKIAMIPFRALQGLYRFGKAATFGLETAAAATAGGIYGAAKEGAKATRGEEVNLANIPIEAGEFAGFHTLFKAGSGAYQWLKTLKPKQQAEIAVNGILPDDLDPTEYKIFEEKVVPELQQEAENAYKQGMEKAVAENNAAYQKELANVQAKHEQDIYQRQQAGEISEQEYAQYQQDYQNQLKQLAARHESEMAALEQENQIAQQEYQQQQKGFEQLKARQKAVDVAISKPLQDARSLEGRVTQGQAQTSERPTTPKRPDAYALENEVSRIFTNEPRDIDTTALGHVNTLAIRANDRIDRAVVNEAYNLNEELNSQVFSTHEDLISTLNDNIKKLRSIGKLSPQQEQLVQFQEALLKKLAKTNNKGIILSSNSVSNTVLQEQAKAMRQAMDYDFEHGNTRGIFSPTVNAIEDSAQAAAELSNIPEAAEASKQARSIYAEWVKDYDNPYIKPFRDLNNVDYSRNYKALQNVDEYNAAKKVLIKSNAGQQVNNLNKRGVVFDKLNKFMENPRKVNPKQFEEALTELRAVMTPEETQQVRQAFNQARKTPVIQGKKAEKPEEIKEAKKKEITEVKIPLAKPKSKGPEKITKVSIPLKGEVKPTQEMKAAAQQAKITPEEAISKSNTPTGMKFLKEKLSKETFERVGKQKAKSLLYEGKAEHDFTGGELYPIINKNYDMFKEILGEDVTDELLVITKQIAKNRVSVDTMKKLGMKASQIKTLLLFGIL